jgi:integrase
MIGRSFDVELLAQLVEMSEARLLDELEAAVQASLLRESTEVVGRRFAPHQLRHAHAVEMAHEGVPLVVIQRQLGHANPGITGVYLQGIDSSEIISTVHGRPSPTISATAGLEMTR